MKHTLIDASQLELNEKKLYLLNELQKLLRADVTCVSQL